MNPPTPQVKAAMEGRLGNHPDPEGDRLMQEVMDAAEDLERAWGEVGRKPISDRDDFASRRLQRATKAYADHRTKAAPEVVPEPRCEPPEEFRHLRWHWIRGFSGGHHPAEWEDGAWRVTGETAWQSPGAFLEYGWEWHSVASPALPDKRVEPTDEALADFVRAFAEDRPMFASHIWAKDFLNAGLAHFSTPIIPGEPKPELLGDAQGCCDMGAACSCRGKPSLRAGCCFWTDAESLQPATPNDSINSQLEQEKAPRPAAPHPSQSAVQHAVEIFRQGFRRHESTNSFVRRIMDCDDRRISPLNPERQRAIYGGMKRTVTDAEIDAAYESVSRNRAGWHSLDVARATVRAVFAGRTGEV